MSNRPILLLPNRSCRHRKRGLCLLLLCALLGRAQAQAAEDLTAMPLEQLLDVTISSASKYAQKLSEAPSSVTVINSEDLRTYGWRTLADVLRSVGGFYVQYDRNNTFLGVRGFARPGDYNSRVLLLLDGARINDNVYDGGAIGNDLPVDLDLVDHIEIIRGPGSSVYGSNALFAAINLVTRTAEQINGAELAGRVASLGSSDVRATLGRRLDNGMGLTLSLSNLATEGGALHFDDPQFANAQSNFGNTAGTDFEASTRFMGRLQWGEFILTALLNSYGKGDPTAQSGALFNRTDNRHNEKRASLNLDYAHALSSDTTISNRLFWGSYAFRETGAYLANQPQRLDHDEFNGLWFGDELRLSHVWADTHHLIAGTEFQDNLRQDLQDFYLQPYQSNLEYDGHSTRLGVFAQDDWQIDPKLTLSLGGRYDRISPAAGRVNPRLAVIWHPLSDTVVKLLYGTAFRAPNTIESDYVFPHTQLWNKQLRGETIHTWEATVEQYLGSQTRLVASAYFYRLNDLIAQVVVPPSGLLQYQNTAPVRARGLELGIERLWQDSTRLRASVASQLADDANGMELTDSPRRQLKLNLSLPLGTGPFDGAPLRLGIEAQALSQRTGSTGTAGGYGLVNLNLLSGALGTMDAGGFRGWPQQASLSVMNLFDHRYMDPAAYDPALPQRQGFLQDGRTLRLQLVWRL